MPAVRLLRRALLLLVLLAGLPLAALPAAAEVRPAPASTVWPVVRLTPQAPHLAPQPADRPFSAQVHLTIDGRPRTFSVLVPAGLPTPAPVVLGLHGLYQTRESTEAAMRLLREAPARRFIAVYPSGVGASWNAGRCCGRSAAGGVDDVAALRRIVAEVGHAHPVDLSRVSAVGFSNGAMMAHRVACDAPGFLNAVAVVAGADMTRSPCSRVATPTMLVHGGRDAVLPVAGLRTSSFLGTSVPPLASFVASVTRRNDAAGVRTAVVLLPGEGHGWPSPTSVARYDTTARVLDFALRSRTGLRAGRGR